MPRTIWFAAAALAFAVLTGCDSQNEQIRIRVSGTVTAPSSGEPVDSAEVELIYFSFDTQTLGIDSTDSEGRYSIEATVSGERCSDDGLALMVSRVFEGGPTWFEIVHPNCVEQPQTINVPLS